jgi:hypothetical protein
VKSESGKKLDKPLVYFNDIWRKRDKTIEIVNRIVENNRMENCFSCHKSPLITVYPDEGGFNFKKFGERLTRLNNIMSTYSSAKYFGVEESNFGPGMGLSILSACAKAKAMDNDLEHEFNCVDCHNGRVRGVLNFPSGLDLQLPEGTSMVKLFVKDYGIMPPLYHNFSADQRKIVFECLVEDYYGDFIDPKKGRLNRWLLQADCKVD